MDGGGEKIMEGRSAELTPWIPFPGRHLRGDFPRHLREGANETLGVWYWSEASSRRRPLQDARLARRERTARSSCGWKDETPFWRHLPRRGFFPAIFFYILISKIINLSIINHITFQNLGIFFPKSGSLLCKWKREFKWKTSKTNCIQEIEYKLTFQDWTRKFIKNFRFI